MSLYISAKNIKMSYNDRLILQFDQFEVHSGDRIGLVGLNGEGKTTLLNLLYGKVMPTEGKVTRYCEIGYYEQFDENHEKTGMSGGENTKSRLWEAVRMEGHVTFLDEPTSNLDVSGVKSLRHALSEMDTFVLITHEKELLETFCTQIVEVSEQTIHCYKGNYTEYREQKRKEELAKQREYESYIEEKRRLTSVLEGKKKKAADIGKRPRKISPRDARLRNFLASRPYDVKQQSMEKSAKAVESRIAHMEVKEKPKDIPKIALDFSLTNPPENKRVIEGKDVSFSYGSKMVLDQVKFRILNRHHYAVIGDNGAGKTTFLNCITSGMDGVYAVPKAKFGYLYQQFEGLQEEETVLYNMMRDCIQQESVARSILARLLLGEQFMNQKVKALSGGEKMKLAIGKLLVSDANVLLLDEPTNYLDMPSVEAVTEVLKEYEGTLLLVSHDFALIEEAATDLIVIKNHGLKQFAGSYEEYKQSEKKDKKKEAKHIQIQSLEMELVAVVSRISMAPETEKEELEETYQGLLRDLKQLRQAE